MILPMASTLNNDDESSAAFELKSEEFLRKHVNAVALMPVKGGRRISLLGRRLFNVLLYRSIADGDQPEYHARLHELVADSEYSSTNTKHLKKILLELLSTTVQWQSPTMDEMEEWEACNLLSGAGIKKDRSSGGVTIRWRFDEAIRNKLLAPERYALLSLEAITQLSTHSAMALYEICARYVDTPGHKTARRHWRWWRPVLTGVVNNDDTAEYRFFKRDVLHKAVAEINALTNLEVTGPIEHKERDNKTIADIQFEVRMKSDVVRNKEVIPLAGLEATDLILIGRAIRLGISQTDAEKIVRTFSYELADEGIAMLEKRMQMPLEKVGEVFKPVSLLKSYLRTLRTRRGAEPNRTDSLTISEQQDLKDAWTKEWLVRKRAELLAVFKESNKDEQATVLSRFRTTLTQEKHAQIVKRFDEFGWDHRMVRASFTAFLGFETDGKDWDRPGTDALLAVAMEKIAKKPGRRFTESTS